MDLLGEADSFISFCCSYGILYKALRIYLLKIFLMLDVCSVFPACVSHLVLWLAGAYSQFLYIHLSFPTYSGTEKEFPHGSVSSRSDPILKSRGFSRNRGSSDSGLYVGFALGCCVICSSSM